VPSARLEKGQTPAPASGSILGKGEKFPERSVALLVKVDNKGCGIFLGFTHANSRVSAIYL
jgi:hypothetical protein